MDEQTLADRQRVLDSDHPDILGSRNNLARSLESAGRLDEAIDLYEQTLSESEGILGSDHPSTLINSDTLPRPISELDALIRPLVCPSKLSLTGSGPSVPITPTS